MRRIVLAACCLVAFALVARADEEKPKPATPDVTGYWLGILKVGPIHLRLVFHVEKDKDKEGQLKAKLISVDQGRAEIPCKSVTFADRKLTIDVPAALASYKGTLDEKGTAFDGEFKQVKQVYPL